MTKIEVTYNDAGFYELWIRGMFVAATKMSNLNGGCLVFSCNTDRVYNLVKHERDEPDGVPMDS